MLNIYAYYENFQETKRGEHNLGSEWLSMNENVAHTKALNCTNVIEIKNTERYLFKIRCKRENTVSKNADLTGDYRETRN